MEQEALVLGAGRSGQAAARLLLAEGWAVTLVDEHTPAIEPDLLGYGRRLRVRAGCTDLPAGDWQLCVASPGINPDHRWVREVNRRDIALLGELDLGWDRLRGKAVAVTGSNGKSTAVAWIAAALMRAGRRPRIAGNYELGPPLTQAVQQTAQADPWVIEASSFQLEYASRVHADYVLILDIHPNHLDRHGTLENYIKIKMKLAQYARPGGMVVMPWQLRAYAPSRSDVEMLFYGSENEPAAWRYERGRVIGPSAEAVSLEGTVWSDRLRGRGAAGALALLHHLGVSPREASDALRSLRPLPHRMAEVGVFCGVRVIDDSKATNLAAAAAALESAGTAIRWVAGGRPKEKDFKLLRSVVPGRVRGAYFYGEAAGELGGVLGDLVPCQVFERMEDAVACAWEEAREGETLLLAPACTSFDQFRDFCERGEVFSELVKKLAKEVRKWETTT